MTNIYLITDGIKYVKIGRSKDLNKRIIDVQVGNPEQLYLYDTIENVKETFETYLHNVCTKYHIKGEWFSIEVIKHLRNTSPLKALFLKNLRKRLRVIN